MDAKKEKKKELTIDLLKKNIHEYVLDKFEKYGSLENMPENVRETVEALMDQR